MILCVANSDNRRCRFITAFLERSKCRLGRNSHWRFRRTDCRQHLLVSELWLSLLNNRKVDSRLRRAWIAFRNFGMVWPEA